MVGKEKGALPEERYTHTQHDCNSPSEKKQHISQKSKILEYMEKHGSITQEEAIKAFRCFRLPARISELRKDYNIETVMEPNKDYGQHARYFLR